MNNLAEPFSYLNDLKAEFRTCRIFQNPGSEIQKLRLYQSPEKANTCSIPYRSISILIDKISFQSFMPF